MRLLTAAGLAPLFVTGAAQAQAPNPIDCDNASTTVEMNYCTDLAFQKADAALNDAYRHAIASLKDDVQPPPYDPKSWEEALRASQRAWVAYRDAECKGHVPMEWTGGTGTTSAVNACLIEMTEARTKSLKERYGTP